MEKETIGESLLSKIKNPIRRDVMQIAWPVFIELLLGSLFGMVDMMMLGRMKDAALAAASVASVGITNQPLFMGLSLVQALNVGGTAMIARYYGAKQNHRMENVLKHVMILSMLFLALPLSILGIIFTKQIMGFMGAKPDAIEAGYMYFKIIMIGFIFQSLIMSLSAALRGVGETKVPMAINIRSNFINVIGNAVLIYGLFGFPELGVTGAAISTSFSNMVAAVSLLYYVAKGKSVVKLNIKKPFRFNKYTIRNLIRIGVPASLEQLVLRLGNFFFIRVIASLGTVIYASHQIAMNILALSYKPGQAFGISAASLVGKSLGASQLKDAEEYAKENRRIGSIIASIMGLVFFFLGPQLVGLYTRDPIIIENASNALKIVAIVQPFQVSQFILAGALRGAGDTVWPLVATFFGVLIIRVVIAYVLIGFWGFGLIGAWIGLFIDQIIRWVFVYGRFRTGKWKHVDIK